MRLNALPAYFDKTSGCCTMPSWASMSSQALSSQAMSSQASLRLCRRRSLPKGWRQAAF